MTATKTPSQRGRSNRNRGLQCERDLCKWLRSNGFPHAERAVRTGFRASDRVSADPGDITGTPGVVWSVKDCAVEEIRKWLAELDAMDDRPDVRGEEPTRLLIHKRRGHADPAHWWCWVRVHQFAELLDMGAQTSFVFPVRAELGDVVPLLHLTGYGSPIEAVS